MYSAKIQNANGEMLQLTGNEAVYQVIDIQGLNPPKAQINKTTIVGLDGAVFNSSKLETRNIVLTVKINGEVEANRLNLYTYFRTKEWVKFFYTNNSLDVSIEGYVDSVECNLFSNAETAQISIICLYPYFKGISEIVQDFSNVIAAFTFPFSINLGEPVVISTTSDSDSVNIFNASESETGASIYVDVVSAINTLTIQNTTTGDSLTLNYSFQSGDKIIIDTNKGQKSIKLIRSGVISNLFSALQQGSVFFQLQAGNNIFEYTANGVANSDSVSIMFRFYLIYRGV